MRTRGFWVIGAATAGWLVAAALLCRTSVPGGLRLADVAPSAVFPEAFLGRSDRYAEVLRWLWLGATATHGAVLVGAVLLTRATRLRGIRGGVVLALGTFAAVWVAGLPFVLLSHWWRRRYGVSDAAYSTILVDPWLERLGALAAAAVAVALFMLLARRLGDRWWIVGGPAFAVVGAAFVLGQPLLLTPRVEPLRDRAVVREIEALAREQGVGEVEVQVEDASRRTHAINAEFFGLGPTKRVVLWDTALAGLSRRELRVLVSHEFGHVQAHHVWKSVGWLFLFAVPGAWIVARATRGRGGLGQAAAIPVALLTLFLLELALLPPTNAISRRYEREADWKALTTTRDPAAFERLSVKLARAALSDPDPPRWARLVLGTHPTPMQRIRLARTLRAEGLPEGS